MATTVAKQHNKHNLILIIDGVAIVTVSAVAATECFFRCIRYCYNRCAPTHAMMIATRFAGWGHGTPQSTTPCCAMPQRYAMLRYATPRHAAAPRVAPLCAALPRHARPRCSWPRSARLRCASPNHATRICGPPNT